MHIDTGTAPWYDRGAVPVSSNPTQCSAAPGGSELIGAASNIEANMKGHRDVKAEQAAEQGQAGHLLRRQPQGAPSEVHFEGGSAKGEQEGAARTTQSKSRGEEEAFFKTRPVAKWADGDLMVGTTVWYRGSRYWIEYIPPSFEESSFVRLSSSFVDPTPGRLPNKHRESFHVHADLVVLAPFKKNRYENQPSLADVARAERAKEGITDVGDEIAILLRTAKTLEDTYRIAGKFLNTRPDELSARYGHLNNGQQRMNLGNRMRSHMKKRGGRL